MKKKKRTRNQLILEELGCPHRWNKYARKKPWASKGKCIDCGKSRVEYTSEKLFYIRPDTAPFLLLQKKGAPRSKHSFTWNEKP